MQCIGSGQDAEYTSGVAWPVSRFRVESEVVTDRLTGLQWTQNANLNEFPLDWSGSLELIQQLNRNRIAGFNDWRLPNRRELRSLLSYQTRNPALPENHPFRNVFLGWYWTNTSAAINPAYAWYIHMEGGRMFYGRKDEDHLIWPVRGSGNDVLPATGQKQCFNAEGQVIPCVGSGQDGEYQYGATWPPQRFDDFGDVVLDRLTNLVWTRNADLASQCIRWQEAFEVIKQLNSDRLAGSDNWCLPTINELESLVEASQHTPGLEENNPFTNVQEAYWSSTTSAFEPDWCMALYMYKGAVGVGQKKDPNFSVWAVNRRFDFGGYSG